MTGTQLNQYKRTLESRQAEIERLLRNLDGIAVERVPDQVDDWQETAQRELTISNLDRYTRLLGEVRAALDRIAGGIYGECLNCGEPIAPARLSAVPWTQFCRDCQEMADRERGWAAA